jgi:lipoprotein-anchoring transpeptidase ErfK/SrfK
VTAVVGWKSLSRPKRAGAFALGAVVASTLVVACAPVRADNGSGSGPAASDAVIAVSPGDHRTDWNPSKPVILTVAAGTFKQVAVAGGGHDIVGHFLRHGTVWKSKTVLDFGTSYRVKAVAVDSTGRVATAHSAFRTVHPKSTLRATVTPGAGWTVGVGMPIIVTFSQPVPDRAKVEGLLHVSTSPFVQGSWFWVSDEMVRYRPKNFWPAGTKVTVDARLAGQDLGKGVWGGADVHVPFAIGAATIDTVDIASHELTVKQNGKLVKTIPVTTGKPGWDTRVGTKVIMSRQSEVTMDAATLDVPKNSPDYYRLKVQWAMRLTWSGEYLHAAPWSVAYQGHANVSHGCTGMSTENALWLFNFSKVGDPVIYINGTRPMEPWNGYTDWNMSWSDWLAGSALH